MRFLADEGCDEAVVVELRALSHDVLSVREACRGASDEKVLSLAVADGRTVRTEDKDFGQLVYSALAASAGVVLLRFGPAARSAVLEALVKLLTEHEEGIRRAFVVVSPGRIRIARPPART